MASKDTPLTYVGIGASAGGLEALQALLAGLDADVHATYIIAQHLDPNHPSMLRELLSRATQVPVALVEEGLQPESGVIYITPPGQNVIMRGERLHLEPVSHVGPKPSVSLFFSTLADTMGERVIGIILSGTGSDGAEGIRQIKARGGITIAQDQQSARYTGMPRSAIDTGLVDLVMTPAEIGEEIAALVASASPQGMELQTPRIKSSLERIFQRLFEQTGVDFSGYKLKTIQRRLQRRMSLHKLTAIDKYVELLEHSSAEVELLFKDILISVTSFFRDPEAFRALEAVITQLVQDKSEGESIRVWTPASATGEEAYTLAMLFHRAFRQLGKEVPLQIFATDIDEDALLFARRGVYGESSVHELPTDIKVEFFRVKEGYYHVSKLIRESVIFARQDLVNDPPFSRIDLITCRNLLIYFNNRLQKRIMRIFHYALREGGYLFLGKSESIGPTTELFSVLNKKAQIYQRTNTLITDPLDYMRSSPANTQSRKSDAQIRTLLMDETESVKELLDKAVLRHMVPAAVIVDGNGRILQIRGDVSPYFSFPEGRLEMTLMSLLREELRVDLRGLMQRARKQDYALGQAISFNNRYHDRFLILSVIKLRDGKENDQAFALVFQNYPANELSMVRLADASSSDNPMLDELRQELISTREHLQTSIEELETTNEELQSTNEELQSANEELQSANEELQTANEELQSTNEELATVNEELEIKSAELASVNSDLENVLGSLCIPMIVLDNRLRVTRYTQSAAELFDIRAVDTGQVITALGYKLPVEGIKDKLLEVIEAEVEHAYRVEVDHMAFSMRMAPYFSDKHKVVGALLYFERLNAESPHAQVQDALQLISRTTAAISDGVLITDTAGRILRCNQAFELLTGYRLDEIKGHSLNLLVPSPYREQHNNFISDYLQHPQHSRVIGNTREITFNNSQGERLLARLRVEDLNCGEHRFFVAYFKTER